MEASLLSRLETVTSRLEALVSPGAPGGAAAATPPPAAAGGAALSAFDALLASQLSALVAAGGALGRQEVATATVLLQKALEVERGVVAAIAACKQPAAADLQKLLGPLGAALTASASRTAATGTTHSPRAVSAKTDGRRTDDFNHFKALAEASQALLWVAFLPGCGASPPGQQADEAWQSAEFWTNKVLTQYRGKDEKHVVWVAKLKELFAALRAWVKAHHASAVAWNAKGGELAAFTPGAAARPPPPPPPMPPGGPGSLAKEGAAKAAAPSPMNALFGQLNRGESVSVGLRKVTDDMKTKNRSDRSGAVPAGEAPAAAAATPVGGAAKPSAPPRLACEGGRKWVVENQTDARSLEITDCNFKQTVYIYNCRNTVVQVKGKINSLCLDKCVRTSVVVGDMVAAVEIVNSSGVEFQTTGVVPTIAVDNVAGAQLYLSRASLGCAITTAKSTEVNVLIPGATDDADLLESAIPEQFVTEYTNGKWVTSAVAHSAG